MKARNYLVSLFAAVLALCLIASVSAVIDETSWNGGYTGTLAENVRVKVDGINTAYNDISVVAGETITVEVQFDAIECDTDVTIEAELEGEKADVRVLSGVFDVEDGKTYRKTLAIKVPFELKDVRSNDLTLDLTIDGKEFKTEIETIDLRVQRPSYNPVIKSITVSNKVDAGDVVPVEIVVKNVGYNDLDDLYVTVSIAELGIEKSAYFGDIVALECCDEDNDDGCGSHCHDCEEDSDDELCEYECCSEDDSDTVSGKLNIEIPYEAKAGAYNLEVEVSNDDSDTTETKEIVVANDFTGNVIVSNSKQSVAVGENAEYTLLLVNPTDKLKVYRVVTESSSALSSSASSAVVAVPAGSSKSVTIIAKADAEGKYDFTVDVLSGETLVESIALSADVKGSAAKTPVTSNPVVVLTVILAIIFIVLLIVLIVLIGKKPEKSEEFGESYY